MGVFELQYICLRIDTFRILYQLDTKVLIPTVAL